MAVQRGEVYFVELGPTIGREQSGRRPVVVVSSDSLNGKPLVYLVVPGTNASKAPPSPATVLTFQAKAIDPARINSPATGSLSLESMEKIGKALTWSFDL